MDTYSTEVLQTERQLHERFVKKFRALAKAYAAEVVAGRLVADKKSVVRVWKGFGNLFFIPLYFQTKTVFSVTTNGSVFGVNSFYSADVFHITSEGDLVYDPFRFRSQWTVGSPDECSSDLLEPWVEALRDRLESKKPRRRSRG